MWELARLQAEQRLQVLVQSALVLAFPDRFPDRLIHGLLVRFALLRRHISFLLRGENVPLRSLGVLLRHGTLEVAVVNMLRHLELAQLDVGAGSDHISLRNATHWAAVQEVGSGDQEQAGGQHLDEDDSLGLVATSQHDQDAARNHGFPRVARVVLEDLATGPFSDARLGGVVALGLLQLDHSLATIVRSANLLHHCDGGFLLLGHLGFLSDKSVQSLAFEILRVRESHNAASQLLILRLQ